MALSLNTNIIIVTFVFTILALIAVVLRFVARRKLGAALALDDYMILPGLLFTISLGACTVTGAYIGHIGVHVTFSPQGVPEYGPWIHDFEKVEWSGQLISILAFSFIKASLVLFYRRIFRGDRFYLITAILLGIICCWGVSFFLAILFECIPVSQVWVLHAERTGHCYNPNLVFEAMATSNMVIDIAILTIPQPLVWKLKMPLRRRIAVSLVFLLGAFVVGISAARIYFFYAISSNSELQRDVTYNSASAFYWTNIDACVAVICACLPSLYSLVADLSPGHLLRSFASKVSLRASSKWNRSNSFPKWGGSGKDSTLSARGLSEYPIKVIPLPSNYSTTEQCAKVGSSVA